MHSGSLLAASLLFACASGSVGSSGTPRGSGDAGTRQVDASQAIDAFARDMRPPGDASAPIDAQIDATPAADAAPPPTDMAPPAPEPAPQPAPQPEPEPVDMALQPEPEPAPQPEPEPAPQPEPVALPERLIINEIDYEQAGNDLTDFVELLNPAATPAPLDAVTVEFINGDPLEIYRVVPLDGVLPSGGRLVLGQQAVLDALPAGVRGVLIADGIQNGAPDAIRLMTPEGPLDGVAYEGDLPGFGEGAGPVAADQGLDAAGSLARCPDGADTDDNATDVRLVPTPTPGATNDCP